MCCNENGALWRSLLVKEAKNKPKVKKKAKIFGKTPLKRLICRKQKNRCVTTKIKVSNIDTLDRILLHKLYCQPADVYQCTVLGQIFLELWLNGEISI